MTARKIIIFFIILVLASQAVKYIFNIFLGAKYEALLQNKIFVYVFIFAFLLIGGFASVYIGIKGIHKQEIELFWKRYWTVSNIRDPLVRATGNKRIEEIDKPKDGYAVVWGFIYILFGLILLSSLVLVLFMFKG